MQGLFWNPDEQRLRALWRILVMVGLYILVVRGTRWLFMAVTGSEAILTNTTPIELFRLIVMLILLSLMARYVDKRHFSDYGLHLQSGRWWVDFGFSFALTALLISLLFGIQTYLGWITISSSLLDQGPGAVAGQLLLPLLSTIAVAFYIELFFRGYLITNLGEGFNFLGRLYQPRLAVKNSSKIQQLLNSIWQRTPVLAAWLMATLFFLVVRVDSDVATNVLLLNLLRASFLLTLPFVLTRSLAIPIGLNLGWNMATQNVYGLKILGGGLLGSEVGGVLSSVRALLVVVQSGPEMLTGGPLGPEGGLLGMATVVLAGMVVMLWLRRRQGSEEPAVNPWTFPYQPV
jgi:hypothetical protein